MSDRLTLLKFPPRKPPATPQTFTDPTRQRLVDDSLAQLREMERINPRATDITLTCIKWIIEYQRHLIPSGYQKGWA